MIAPNIKTSSKATPMIYAYTTPGVVYHDGYIKIGQTERSVDDRLSDQATAWINIKEEWKGTAIYDDGSFDVFRDKDFHLYLRANGIKQPKDRNDPNFTGKGATEWFYISPTKSKSMFFDFKQNRGAIQSQDSAVDYVLRKEQEEAVSKTVEYRQQHKKAEFLWNCKPRFGKTLCVYDFVKRIGAKNVLIVTNRPAIANSWYSDYAQFLGRSSGYFFVSQVPDLSDKAKCPLVMQYQEFANDQAKRKSHMDLVQMGLIDFVSLQDLKGSIYFGGEFAKLEEISRIHWDVLVIDEAHEGVDTYKTDVAFDRISRDFTLHLSGTPFKALANSKFPSNAIYNWTYADEQQAKRDFVETFEEENPYDVLPQINMYTYQMSEIIKEQLERGIEIQGETEEYAFDLNEFFRTDGAGRFIYNKSVDAFLDALTTQEKYPFSTSELRNELKHSFWLLDRVASARALSRKLQDHPIFKDYEIILAAGDGKIDDDDENAKSFDRVTKAIREHDKTITLSVGQLTTGVTIPEWTAVLMLSNVASPALYMQAAFRAQNPCLFRESTTYLRKKNCYVFDFDPARTLDIYEKFANDLSSVTAGGHGNLETRKSNIKTLLNFFPVIGEDEHGELIALDSEKVLTLPRKIRSVEVVRRGFMSNFLFQNIAQVFGAPPQIMSILDKMPSTEESARVPLAQETKDSLFIDDKGDVSLPDEYVKNKTKELFGDKIEDESSNLEAAVEQFYETDKNKDNKLDDLKKSVHDIAIQDIASVIKDAYGDEIRPSDTRRLEVDIKKKVDKLLDKQIEELRINQNINEQKRSEEMQRRHETGRTTEEIDAEYDEKRRKIDEESQISINVALDKFFDKEREEATRTVEKTVKERQKRTIEDGIRDHLRGFSRTIPSFLMAYGDDTVTLATFDNKVPVLSNYIGTIKRSQAYLLMSSDS